VWCLPRRCLCNDQRNIYSINMAESKRLCVTLSVETPLCPYGIAYRRGCGLHRGRLFTKFRCSPQCALALGAMAPSVNRNKRITSVSSRSEREREFFIGNPLVRIHLIIVMIRWTGLAPRDIEFLFPGSLTSIFLDQKGYVRRRVLD
jgi:hypothetical protein